MSHVREQIRLEIVQRLRAIPSLANSVKASRVWAERTFPGVTVYTDEEEAEPTTMARPGTSTRQLNIVIEIYSKAGSEFFDGEIDDISVLVENALTTAPGAFEMAKMWYYTGMRIEYSSETDRAGAVAQLNYRFTYRINDDNAEIGV